MELLLRRSVFLLTRMDARLLATGASKQPTGSKGKASSGDGDGTESYKVQEYFNYNEQSFYDWDVKMAEFRIKQPDGRPSDHL
eukprot:m.308396 g.308396  ORF g.308396 m.308396 type:complete len:83 (+) comp43922_c0_seq1:19-267(+)